MRRLLLLALLAAVLPGAAWALTQPPAPTSGQITYPTVAYTSEDEFINWVECSSTTAAAQINTSWVVAVSTTSGGSVASITKYQLYAYNLTTAHSEAPTDAGTACPTTPGQDSDTALVAVGPVGQPVTANSGNPGTMTAQAFSLREIAVVAGKGATCDYPSAEPIVLCVQGQDSSGTAVGAARAKLSVVTFIPPAPTAVTAGGGNQALNVGFTATTDSTSFEIVADPVGTITAGAVRTSSGRITAKSYRLGGLVNDQTYAVTVFGFTDADNVATSTPVLGVPAFVNDFFGVYQADGGQEQGGCAGGPGGPLALLGVAAALALVRRKK